MKSQLEVLPGTLDSGKQLKADIKNHKYYGRSDKIMRVTSDKIMRSDIARANDALTVVNDWQLHLFKNGDAAASIFGAVGLQAISFSSSIHFSDINLYSNETT